MTLSLPMTLDKNIHARDSTTRDCWLVTLKISNTQITTLLSVI